MGDVVLVLVVTVGSEQQRKRVLTVDFYGDPSSGLSEAYLRIRMDVVQYERWDTQPKRSEYGIHSKTRVEIYALAG